MAVPNFKKTQGNSASTTLSSGVASGDTSAPLTSDTNFAGEGMVVLSEGENVEEFAYATTKAGGALTIPLVNRGLEGGSAQTHSSGSTVKGILTSGMWNDMIDGILTQHNDDGTHGAVTATSVALGGDTALAGNASQAEVATGTSDALVVTPTGASIYGNSSMARQAIINGNFDVWQRGTSVATPDVTNTFQADRWADYPSKDGGTLPTLTRSRGTHTSGDVSNSYYYSRLTTDGAGTSLGASSVHYYIQNIEHGTRLLCGASKTVTVSFWARSDITDKRLGLFITQKYGTGGSPSSNEIINGTNWTLTSSWTKYTHTFTTNTLVGKTFGTNNDDYLALNFNYIWGTTSDERVGATTAEDYGGAGYIDIAQVQLCAGSSALPFQPKSYGEELRACQRYYYRIGGAVGMGTHSGYCKTTTVARLFHVFPVILRATPTPSNATVTGSVFQLLFGGSGSNVTAISHAGYTTQTSFIEATVASGLTVGQGAQLYAGTTDFWIAWDAEF